MKSKTKATLDVLETAEMTGTLADSLGGYRNQLVRAMPEMSDEAIDMLVIEMARAMLTKQ